MKVNGIYPISYDEQLEGKLNNPASEKKIRQSQAYWNGRTNKIILVYNNLEVYEAVVRKDDLHILDNYPYTQNKRGLLVRLDSIQNLDDFLKAYNSHV